MGGGQGGVVTGNMKIILVSPLISPHTHVFETSKPAGEAGDSPGYMGAL